MPLLSETTEEIMRDAGMQVSDQITFHVSHEEGDLCLSIIKEKAFNQ